MNDSGSGDFHIRPLLQNVFMSPDVSGFNAQSSQPRFVSKHALRTILRDEGWRALYKGLGPGLLLVSHGAIQFTAYEEARKFVVRARSKLVKKEVIGGDEALTSVDYVALGAFSKFFAVLLTYPYQVLRARVQQRPNSEGAPRYRDSYHAFKETLRYEGLRGLYKGIVPNLLKNVPASSITFLVYENVLKLFKGLA